MSSHLPTNPSLENLKNQAKTLLKSYQAGNSEVLSKIKKLHPSFSSLSKFGLRNAQLVIAREYGFDNWSDLKKHVFKSEQLRKVTPEELKKIREKNRKKGIKPHNVYLEGVFMKANLKGANLHKVNLWAADLQGADLQAHDQPLYKRLLAIYEMALGPDHPHLALSLNNLAALYCSHAQYAEAEALHKRALAIREKSLGKDHPDVAQSLNNLALLYDSQGRYAEAEPLHKRSLAIREKSLGKNHPLVALSLNNLAALYCSHAQYAEAEALHKRALAIREKSLGKDHPDVAISLNNLGGLYKTQGHYVKAEPLYIRALEIYEITRSGWLAVLPARWAAKRKALGPDQSLVATSLENYAALLRETQRTANAEEMEARAKAIRAKHAGEMLKRRC